jgi:hypothetical protein
LGLVRLASWVYYNFGREEITIDLNCIGRQTFPWRIRVVSRLYYVLEYELYMYRNSSRVIL